MNAPRVLLATGNRGKVREFAGIFPWIDWVSLRDVGLGDLPETGRDYDANAAEKARAASMASGLVTVADDSGLDVDALGGAPGWFSARFSGAHGDDAGNRARLLAAMGGVPAVQRRVRFRCSMALADHAGALGERVITVHGTCEGWVAQAARGGAGFGYDPAITFVPDGPTLGELTDDVKNTRSHRAMAARRLEPLLRAYLVRRGGGAVLGSIPPTGRRTAW